ncbi:unnamed protein product [Orchesella dallaii]|uniref:Odorant receptor n=1 Tax=Orchesella dallaii TaxID=48710 RepID=A0ABP1PYZ0_9HEXA
MLSRRYFRIFGFQISWSHILMGTPFCWNRKERRLFVTKFSQIKYTIAVSFLIGYGLFLVGQVIRFKMMGKTTDFYFYFLYALAVCAVIDTLAASPFLLKSKQAAALITELWNFLDEICCDYMPTFDPNVSCDSWIFDIFLTGIGALFPLFGLIISCHYLLFPHWPVYLSSLVDPEDLTIDILLASGLIYFYGLQMIWAFLLNVCVVLLTIGRYCWLLADEFYCDDGSQGKKILYQKTTSAFHQMDTYRLYYRQFEILHVNVLQVFSFIIVPGQALILNLALFCNFSLVRYSELMNVTNAFILLLWSIGGSFAAFLGLHYCGSMYNKSVKVLRSIGNKNWGSSHNNKLMKKFAKSCKPISYGYGRMYVIRKISVFKFFLSLIRGTFRALLTIKG